MIISNKMNSKTGTRFELHESDILNKKTEAEWSVITKFEGCIKTCFVQIIFRRKKKNEITIQISRPICNGNNDNESSSIWLSQSIKRKRIKLA